MKNLIKSLLAMSLVLFSLNSLQAQKKVSVTESAEEINGVKGTALTVIINKSSEKEIIKEWKKTMKRYGASVKTKKNEAYASNANISTISEYPIQIFSKIKNNKKEESQTFSAIFLNGNIPISKSSDVSGFTAAKKIIEDFANQMSKAATTEFMKGQEKMLSTYNKEVKNIEKESKKASKDIEKKKKEIEKLENTVKDNEKRKVELEKKIKDQKNKVKDAKKEVDLYK